MLIEQKDIQGEIGTGYEPEANKGPFACDNCEYFNGSSCGQKNMMKFSRLPRDKSGRPIVDPHGCCEFVSRKGNAFF